MYSDIDGFAYAEAFKDGRYVNVTLERPIDVHPSGLIVEPGTAKTQIQKENEATQAQEQEPDVSQDGPPSNDRQIPGDEVDPLPRKDGNKGSGTQTTFKQLTRFHATKELDPNRVVRDVGMIFQEILSHFTSTGTPMRVSLDIESDQINKLTEDQRTAIRENLRTLGFEDDQWAMD
jgi:hypothetical protein